VNPYRKEADFLKLNPRGLVPTLECPVGPNGEGRPLFESNIICEYLNEVYDDEGTHGPNLLPRDPYQRARCRVWIDFVSSRIVPSFYRWLQHLPEKNYSIEEVREEFLGHLKTFVKEMDQTGPFFMGEMFSLVDACLAPWLVRLFLIDHYKPGGLGIPDDGKGGENEDLWRRWRVWADAVGGRKSVKETSSEREMYIHVYQRYAEDTTQSQVSQATRAGRNLP
jgi:glutathione S-transferase